MYDLYANCLYVAIAVYTTFLQSYAEIHEIKLAPTADHCFSFFVYWTFIKAFNDVIFLPGTIIYDIVELIEHIVFLIVYIVLLGTIGNKIPGLITAWIHLSIVMYGLLVLMYIRTIIVGPGKQEQHGVKRVIKRKFVAFNGIGLLITTAAASIAEIVVTAALDAGSSWTANQILCVIVVFNEGYSWAMLYVLRWFKQITWKYDCNTGMRALGPRMFLLVGICIVATDVFANESLDPIDFSFIWLPLLWMLCPSAMLMEVEILHPLELKWLMKYFDQFELLFRKLSFKKNDDKPSNNNNNNNDIEGQNYQWPTSVSPQVVVVTEPTSNSTPQSPQPQPITPQPQQYASEPAPQQEQVPQNTTPQPVPYNNNEAPSQPAEPVATESAPAVPSNNNSAAPQESAQPQQPSAEPSNTDSVQ